MWKKMFKKWKWTNELSTSLNLGQAKKGEVDALNALNIKISTALVYYVGYLVGCISSSLNNSQIISIPYA